MYQIQKHCVSHSQCCLSGLITFGFVTRTKSASLQISSSVQFYLDNIKSNLSIPADSQHLGAWIKNCNSFWSTWFMAVCCCVMYFWCQVLPGWSDQRERIWHVLHRPTEWRSVPFHRHFTYKKKSLFRDLELRIRQFLKNYVSASIPVQVTT